MTAPAKAACTPHHSTPHHGVAWHGIDDVPSRDPRPPNLHTHMSQGICRWACVHYPAAPAPCGCASRQMLAGSGGCGGSSKPPHCTVRCATHSGGCRQVCCHSHLLRNCCNHAGIHAHVAATRCVRLNVRVGLPVVSRLHQGRLAPAGKGSHSSIRVVP